MELAKLKQAMAVQRNSRRRPRRFPSDGLIASSSWSKRIKASPCQQDCVPTGSADADDPEASPCQQDCVPAGSTDASDQAKREASYCGEDGSTSQTQTCLTDGCSGPNLPEDIWRYIHSLMPLRDAAQAGCVSQSFGYSWRCYPNLIFKRETLGLDELACEKETSRDFRSKINHILRNHSGNGVRKLNLWLVPNYNTKDCCYIDSWLQKAVTPRIEELTLSLSTNSRRYKFPCTLLSNGMGDSLRCLNLGDCSFHPTAGLCCLRSLVKLELFMVHITGDELWSLLSSSSALERLSIKYCSKVNCLKIPCHLQRLSHVEVHECSKLRVIESKAPNLSRFHFAGKLKVHVSLGEALQVKNLHMNCTAYGCDTQAELASSTPSWEVINSAMVSSKFVDLQSVNIELGELPFGRSFDCSSLVSLHGSSLSLGTFISHVSSELMQHALVFGGPSGLWMSGTGSALSPANKKLVELACHVLRGWLC